MKLDFQSYILDFRVPSGTSRGILTQKLTYLLRLQTFNATETEFYGECGLFPGLSADGVPNYEEKLKWVCQNFDLGLNQLWEELREFPSIQFGIEQIFKAQQQFISQELHNDFNPILFPSNFTEGKEGIPINGLIWMGDETSMRQQIQAKIEQGFRCLKLKIAVDWETEHKIISQIRKEFDESTLEIRVDANGGFTYKQAPFILDHLAQLKIHSIEQPIKAGQWEEMAQLCAETPTPITLDEELIGVFHQQDKAQLLKAIQPQYIILKPSLVGGWKGSQEWIDLAEQQRIGWWITSALESNIGLNAIAQWTFTLNNPMPQGLGTGSLFKNNFESYLKVIKDQLFFNNIN